MKTLKLLIKTSFFNKNNDFLCFDIIKYIFNRRSNKVFISYITKINTFNQDVLRHSNRSHWSIILLTYTPFTSPALHQGWPLFKCNVVSPNYRDRRKHATAHNGAIVGLPKTWQDRRNRKITFLARGRQTGRQENMTIQTNFFKAKLWKLTLTRTSDPNRPTTRRIIWQLSLTRKAYSWH